MTREERLHEAALGDGREWANCERCGEYRPLSQHCPGAGVDIWLCDECEDGEK